MRALVTGATGFVGRRLTRELLAKGYEVRALVRTPDKARDLERAGAELVQADLLEPATFRDAGNGVDVAYYLVHAMGRGGDKDFEARESKSAIAFAQMAVRCDVPQVVYLGGLGERPGSKHLKSRHATAMLLAEHGPPLTYFRAGMVVGAGSESYRTLHYLVKRLPVMVAPRWLRTQTQAIAIDDVVDYLVAAAGKPEALGREIQIGSPDVLSYGQMLDAMAEALGLPARRKIPLPLLSPHLSALWIGLVTPVDTGVARPLVEGLATETVVTDPAAATLFDVRPMRFRDALTLAVAEEAASSASGPAATGARRSPAGARKSG